MYENLRELSNSLTARVYLLKTGEIVITRTEEEQENLTGIVAYTWYQTRSKKANKWSIQLVSQGTNGN
jgi:hypothetical protein